METFRSIEGELKLLQRESEFIFPVELWLLNDKLTRNGWRFTNLAEHREQWAGVPILTAYVNGGRVVGDAHNQTTRYDENGEQYQSFTDSTAERIVGAMSDDPNDIRIEERNGAEWVVGKGFLWAWYAHELCLQIANDAEQGRSMSVSIEALVTDSYMEGDVEVETSYKALGVTILGHGVMPAVDDAHIAMLSEIGSELKELKLRAASYIESAKQEPQNNPTNEGVKDRMIKFSKKQIRELQAKFADHRILSAEQDEQGNVVVALLSNVGETAVYVMASLDETVYAEKIQPVNAQVHFAADGHEDVCVDACDIMETMSAECAAATTRAESAERELSAAKETITKMETAENSRRLSAAKKMATDTLNAFNANREDKVDMKVLEALNKDIEGGKFTACADENGAWTGEKLVEKEVKALCADAVMELDKAAAAKRSEPKAMTWGNVKQASANPGTIGELFASKN